MKRIVILGALLFMGLLPVGAWAFSDAPATFYSARGRVVSAIDDEVEGVSYTRTQFTLVNVVKDSGAVRGPELGAGSTVTAIVRDPAARATVKSLNTSSTIDFRLAWFDENTYEVVSIASAPAATVNEPSTTVATATPSITREVILFLSAAAIAGLVLLMVRHHTRV